jgi:hypothetical protein
LKNAEFAGTLESATVTTDNVYAHVVGNQQRDAVENRSVRIEEYAVN